MILSNKRITKALIRLRGCAGWSAPVLFAHLRRQVFSRRGSNRFTTCICIVAVRHARNLIWTQTPSLKTGVSRIVGIEGDPSVWVPSGNVQVRHISAPHMGWQFRALAFHYADQTLYWTEAANKKIQVYEVH